MSETNKSNWKRHFTNQELETCRKIKAKIIEKQATKTGVSTHEILQLMSHSHHFIGCFAENEVRSLVITNFPSYMIVNTDNSNLPGSHWIGILIDRQNVEIFDSSGFNLFHLRRIPCNLLSFIHRITESRHLVISHQLQAKSSTLCGFYALFFIICRQHFFFSEILSFFTDNLTKNDRRLINFF